jgi:hypothetical protein
MGTSEEHFRLGQRKGRIAEPAPSELGYLTPFVQAKIGAETVLSPESTEKG